MKAQHQGPGMSGGGAFEKQTQKASVVLGRLFKYLYAYKWFLALALCLSIISNLLALLGPKLSGQAIDAIGTKAGHVNFPVVFYFVGLMLACYLISSLLSYALAALMMRLSRNIVCNMRKDVFEKLTKLPISFFDKHRTGDVISVISYDIDTINASLSSDLVQMLASAITVIGSFVMMVSISTKLLLVFVVTIPISILFTRYRSKKVRALYRKRSAKSGALNGFVEEMTGGQKTIKAYGREQVFITRFDEKNEAAVNSNYQADCFASITGPSINFINLLSLALISILGSVLYMTGGISLGSISSFVLYSRKFSGPINEFANIVGDLQASLAACERVLTLLDEKEEPADPVGAASLKSVLGDVEINDVNFGYEAGKDVLHDIKLHATPGKVIAIVGATGCGKTTIIHLLMRFYDVERGAIVVDGHDIRHVSRESLRRSYTMVLQDTWLFSGTIFENIAYGKENATKEEVVRAAKDAKIHSYIMSLPKGYDTRLTGDGMNISKGQKQLLTIARAMLVDSPMLILDEATSNVDTQTERSIQAAMLTLMRGRTCFVIAHRLSTIQNADHIIVMNDGRIVEQGRHDELMKMRKVYYEMYRAQFTQES